MYTLTQIQPDGRIGPWRAAQDALGRFSTLPEATAEADRRNKQPADESDPDDFWIAQEAREEEYDRGYGPAWD